jgi:TatD DNase family protein
MTVQNNWVDAHGHLADLRWQGQQDLVLKSAQNKGIGFFMQGGVGPEDWQRQKALHKKFPQQIGLCFGLHPYWVAEHNDQECDDALDLLAREIPQAMGLGELGLDFRPHIMGDSKERQFQVFEHQLELAHISNKPLVLHLVRAHEESLKFMDIFGLPAQKKGFVHSFNGSAAKAQDFLKRGLSISIGGPVCRPDNTRLHQAVSEIPLEYLLIESDCPDQAPPGVEPVEGLELKVDSLRASNNETQGPLNPPESILEVAKTLGKLKFLDPAEILDITTRNFHRLFGGPQS